MNKKYEKTVSEISEEKISKQYIENLKGRLEI